MTNSTITRLRRANPEPLAPAVDGMDLFAEITALPREAGTRGPRRRRGVVLAIALAVTVLLASTAYAFSNWVFDDVVGPDVSMAEYLAAQRELTLPPGTSWPTFYMEQNSVTGRGAGGGHAVLAAQNAWECYWAKAIRTGKEPAQRRAHAILERPARAQHPRGPAGSRRELGSGRSACGSIRRVRARRRA